MNSFKKKALYAAMLTGIGAMGAAGTASAVYVSPDGTGQVLVYPYYSVNGPVGSTAYTTFSVTNSGALAKIVKVRFRESKNSREVLDFNLFLSPHDVWAAAVVADGTTGAKIVVPNDKSCTYPTIPAAGQPFSSALYTGTTALTTGDDGAGTGLDRTREGYFEIIELGNMNNTTQVGYVNHGASGAAPANCAAIQTANAGQLVTWDTPTNDLFGGASLLNVTTGIDVTYDATAFANVVSLPFASSTQMLGNDTPNFTVADPVSVVFNGTGAITSGWGASLPNNNASGGVQAVSATMMHSSVMNEYVVDTATESSTDWVVSFPTKHYYVKTNNVGKVSGGAIAGTVDRPFENTFWNGSCDTVTVNLWDREEWLKTSSQGFSPATATPSSLCWEANVVTFNNGNFLSSPNSKNIDVETRKAGWAKMDFRTGAAASIVSTGTGVESPAGAHTYTGLPVVGFMVQDFINNNPGINASYGGNFSHKWMTTVTTVTP